MTTATRADAQALLAEFLVADTHYLASSTAYGDGGEPALDAALRLFLARPELGFVWLAYANDDGVRRVVGTCVACYAISTSRGTLVAKLDDVNVRREWTGRGVGTAMLTALVEVLAAEGVSRVDSACHRDNADAWRFYARLGFEPLDEERIALLI
ncbi:MAG: GNAT family N-acetyltransferase [Casimicrobiaceae bacterium]